MNGAKIQLSTGHSGEQETGGGAFYHNIRTGWELDAEERMLVADPSWIMAKNRIIGKTVAFMAELSGRMQERRRAGQVGKSGTTEPQEGLRDALEEIGRIPPKISRGENYKGLPYVVLDYPRCFGKEDVFAIRTLFWWGKYFSVTLHMKGHYKEVFLTVIRDRIALLAGAGFHICVSDDEWRHELEEDNYQSLEGMSAETLETIVQSNAFLKFSSKCPLLYGRATGDALLQLYDTVMQTLGINFPGGEKDLSPDSSKAGSGP
jgi:hypothetical protein